MRKRKTKVAYTTRPAQHTVRIYDGEKEIKYGGIEAHERDNVVVLSRKEGSREIEISADGYSTIDSMVLAKALTNLVLMEA